MPESPLDGYPTPGHHPTKWARYFLLKCEDCGLVAPARIASVGVTYFKCLNCMGVTFDEDWGEDGYEEIPGEIAEEWDYTQLLREDTLLLTKLEGLKTKFARNGELPHLAGDQLQLWQDD